jgi:TP901 family phage tail tape measure protein
MAKNKEVFEYQAKVSVDTGKLGQEIGKVKETLKDLDLGIKIPKGLKEDLSVIENKLLEMQKKTPGIGSTSKDFDKFARDMQKLAGEISIVSEKMMDIEIPDSVIQKNSKKLQKLADDLKNAQAAFEKSISDKMTGSSSATGDIFYKNEIESKRIATLKKVGKGGSAKGAFDKYKTDAVQKHIDKLEGKENLTEKQKVELERAKATLAEIERIEKELFALEQHYKEEQKKVAKAQTKYDTAAEGEKQKITQKYQETIAPVGDVASQIDVIIDKTDEFADSERKVEESAKAFDTASKKIKNLFSATTVFYTIRRVIHGAIQDFQELDKQFNEIAIVSDYSTKEMWKSFSSVNKIAQEFGVTTKNVLEVQNLYYHQGKDMAEVNKLTAQTLTLAKITGMDYERATSDLTAALNAYNIAAEDAVLITDSIAAMDTNAAISSEELMTALTKTASIAANAGMSLQSTEVFLTKMIETTREAPENLGTALKTIIARFGEVKEEIDGEEIELADINKVDTALKSIGISLLDTAGQIRDLDDVFMELSSKWDDLDRNTQRYIATQAAGSRQQSRFIAMMEDYDRTLELTDIAQNSAGLGARQLAESMDSIETSLNRLKSTWQEFYANIINAGLIKSGIDAANGLLTLLNKLPGPTGAIVAAFAIWGVKTFIVDKALTNLGKVIGDNIGKSQILNQLLGTTDKLNKESNQTWFQKGLALAAATERLKEYNNELATNTARQTANNAVQGQFGDNGGVVFDDSPDSNSNQPPVEVPVQPTFSKYLYQELAKNMKNAKGQEFFSSAAEGGLTKALTSSIEKGGLIKKLTGAITKIIPTIVKFLPVIAAVVAALWAVNKIWKEFFKGSTDDTKQLEKLTKAQDEYNSKLKEYNNLKEKAKIIEKYRNRTIKTADEIQEEQEAIKALVDEYPNLLESIDEEGNYHIKNSEAIQAEIDKKRELLELNGQEYTLLRTTYAKQGIYADESTLAGASMKNLKDFYGTIEEDTLKDIAKAIDNEGSFNSTLFKEFAEAYASGEKTSFGKKDFSNLFQGTITSDEDWNTVIETFSEKVEELGTEGAMEEALNAIGYANADGVAKMWKVLNDETGNLYSSLLEGAGEEIHEINVQEAELYVDETLGDKEVSEPLKEALENEFARHKQYLVEQYTRTPLELVNDFFGQDGLRALEGNENVQTDAIEYAEKHIAAILKDIEDTVGIESFEQFLTDAKTFSQAKLEKDIESFESVGKLSPMQAFQYEYLKETKEENDKIIQKVDELLNKWDFTTLGYPANGELAKEEKGQVLDNLGSYLNADQLSQLEDQLEDLGEEGGLNFVLGFNNVLNKTNIDEQLINKFLGTNVKDITSITETILAFKKAGVDTTGMLQDMVNAAGGLDAFAFQDIATEAQKAQSEIEALSKSIEGFGRLISGEGTLSDVGAYLESVTAGITDIKEFTSAINTAMEGVQFTYDGIKISSAGGQSSKFIDDTKARLENEYTIAMSEIKVYEELQHRTAEQDIKLQNAKSKAILLNTQYQETQAVLARQAHEQEIKDLQKEVDLLKKKRDAIKELVDWMREYDRYQNLDRISDELDYEFGNLEYEIEFSTNADVLGDTVEKQLENINRNIAVNQAGMAAAKDDQAMWRDVIEKQNARYVSFDESGNAIVNAHEMQALQERIANLKLQNQEEQAEVLQAEYDGIVKNVEAYTNATKKERDYFKALQDNFSDLKKVQKQVLDDRIELEEKIIKVIQDQEDKELEAIKKKYEAINDENDKYLDSIQKMVDEERRIRDRADSEQEVKDKEKKLAMMKMDTSGVYASDIRALEKELEKDYRSLEDNAVDDAIDKLSNEYEKEAEARNQELTYYQNYLDEKREARVAYLAEADTIIQGGTENILNFLKTKDTEYITGSQAQQEAYILEWENKVARGAAASEILGSSLYQQVATNLDICARSAGGFDQAITSYSQNMSVTSGQINGKLETMADKYKGVAEGVKGVNTQIDKMETYYNEAAIAAEGLRKLQNDEIIPGIASLSTNISLLADSIAKLKKELDIVTAGVQIGVSSKDNFIDHWETVWNPESGQDSIVTEVKVVNGTVYGYVPKYGGYIEGKNLATGSGDDDNLDQLYNSKGFDATKVKKWHIKRGVGVYQFAKGGYVDYTGPAWVDGTKSHPEYMLNATQTAQFEALIDVLSMAYKAPNFSQAKVANAEKTGDTRMEFHINVEGISDDYDVDRAVERIEKKILDSGKYRNTTVLKNSN